MAQRTIVHLMDDIDGSDADESVEFGLDGTTYTIDLNSKNAAELRDVLAPYVGVAQRVTGRRRSTAGAAPAAPRAPRSGGGAADRQKLQDIRQWARDNGHTVSERGRIAKSVVEAYEAAH